MPCVHGVGKDRTENGEETGSAKAGGREGKGKKRCQGFWRLWVDEAGMRRGVCGVAIGF